MKVSWAETLLVLNDEFREGNVSPRKDIKRIVPDFLELVSCLQFLDYCSDFW